MKKIRFVDETSVHICFSFSDTPLLRRSPTNYSDGTYEPSGIDRPNPLSISKIAFGGLDTNASDSRNALLVFFGKFFGFILLFLICFSVV